LRSIGLQLATVIALEITGDEGNHKS
jgi:hypothetical protein